MASAAYNLFRKAILSEKQITCVYQGKYRELCPLIIGHSEGEEKVLAFQFAGETSSGRLPAGGAWKCMFLAQVRDVRLCDGPWHEGSSHKQTQACVRDVDLDINIHVRAPKGVSRRARRETKTR
jgi:hypothetical protein